MDDLNEHETDVVSMGILAYSQGHTLENNPYIECPMKHYWNHGWLMAAEHDEKCM